MKKYLKTSFVALAAFVLCVLSVPSATAQQVGVATRFYEFTNLYFGPNINNNAPMAMTNQTLNFANSNYAEVPLDIDRGLGLFTTISSTNWNNTNTVYFNFDLSPFGSSNKTASITGSNSYLLPGGPYGGYTGWGTNGLGTSNSCAFTWAVVVAGSNTVCAFTNMPKAIIDNMRYIRLTSISNSAQSVNGTPYSLLYISNILGSKFP